LQEVVEAEVEQVLLLVQDVDKLVVEMVLLEELTVMQRHLILEVAVVDHQIFQIVLMAETVVLV
tara:strand:- start:38 stop:229 length:192 start_codon:yes stop_codon:yes gene_type:complete